MHQSQRRRNWLLIQSVFLLEGGRGPWRVVNPVCSVCIAHAEKQAAETIARSGGTP